MLLSSDPHAWLRPYFATLKADPAYQTLAVPLRFRALCDVVAVEHAERAAWMRQSPAGQEARLPSYLLSTVSAVHWPEQS